ncbi:MAG: hypothetical protein ACHQF0_05535 [Chitinophagales bacterium]
MKNIFIFLSFTAVIFITGCGSNQPSSANLIQNGSAELPKYDSVPPNWQNVQGHWVTLEGDSIHHDFAFAQEGNRYFFAGNDTLAILQQDVSVSQFASRIDEQKQSFVFKGYEQSLDQGPNSDQGMISIQGTDSSKTKILYTFNSDTARSISKWQPLIDSFLVPPATRFIRIQLIAIRHVGGDNDGYFDNISLTTQTTGFVLDKKWLFIIIAIVLLAVATSVIYKKNRSKK